MPGKREWKSHRTELTLFRHCREVGKGEEISPQKRQSLIEESDCYGKEVRKTTRSISSNIRSASSFQAAYEYLQSLIFEGCTTCRQEYRGGLIYF